jgi:predicted peptidase
VLVRALLLGAIILMPSHLSADEPVLADYDTRTVTVPETGEFCYRLLRPTPLEPGATYPVVLFLHGAGERGDDNARQLKYLPTWMAEPGNRKRHPCFLIAPQCRTDHSWSAIDWQTKRALPLADKPTANLAAALAALDAVLAEEPVDPARVYLTGLSMGAYGSWDLAARHPHRFAALLPICGGGDAATAPRLTSVPIWNFHGTADPVVPVERSRAMIKALTAAGGTPISSELEDVGHDSWTPAYGNAAVLDWLFAQRRR